ncbi:MAG: hypothetical protein IPK99_14850 [Flavobacteriales bacterium]|nr:hypothetical protein [Flavobacteriales bacterium]
MLDQILSTLQSQAAPELMSKFGLNQQQTNGSIKAATDSVTEVIGGGDGFGMDDVLNLFSDAKNTGGADGILNNIGSVLQGKLTGQVGLNASQAGGVQAMLMPLLTGLVSKYVGGNAGNLQQLIGSFTGGKAGGGGIADMAQGMLGKLFK